MLQDARKKYTVLAKQSARVQQFANALFEVTDVFTDLRGSVVPAATFAFRPLFFLLHSFRTV